MSIQRRRRGFDISKLVYLAVLTAVVIVLQYLALFMRFGTFSLTFVLVPMVIGVALCGWWAGAWLGFVFGLAVFMTGDAAGFLAWDVFGTIVTVMLKGTLAGLAAGGIYKLFERINVYLAVFMSAIAAPVVNTGVFVAGSMLFFYDEIAGLAGGEAVFPFILVAFVGINFFIELGINIILSPTIIRLINIKKKI